jgi:guanylate kinase
MLILVGPSASGKTEIAKALVDHFDFKKIITTTTRPKRPLERDDVDYHFVSLEMFNQLEEHHKFLETSMYQHHMYGLQIEDVISYGIVILDPSGANYVHQKMKDACFIVYVESNRFIRKLRMSQRGDSEESMISRLESDDIIFDKKQLQHYDYICNNDHPHIMQAALLVKKQYQNWLDKGVSYDY